MLSLRCNRVTIHTDPYIQTQAALQVGRGQLCPGDINIDAQRAFDVLGEGCVMLGSKVASGAAFMSAELIRLTFIMNIMMEQIWLAQVAWHDLSIYDLSRYRYALKNLDYDLFATCSIAVWPCATFLAKPKVAEAHSDT